MDIEKEIFKKFRIDLEKIQNFGFIKKNSNYVFSQRFMNDTFRADITVSKDGMVTGKVFDLQFEEEYTNFRIKNNICSFASKVKEEYEEILKNIRNECFIKNYFISSQANRITNYIIDKYHNEPEFLWEKLSDSGVFRNNINNKWYGIIMDVNGSKFGYDQDKIEIMDVKANYEDIQKLIHKKGFYEGYHMNKKNWLTVVLNDTIDDKDIFKLIDNSYNLVNTKDEWIVPANPNFYDITDIFDKTNITNWKQSSNVHIGDIVYIYLGSPYSSIIYKCEVIEVDIPYNFQDKNLSIKKVMKIKLIKKYDQNQITYSKLNELGIKAIRGPRKISKEISEKF